MAFTYFFRDMKTMDIIERDLVPEFKTRGTVNIWDAGCANGAEPYTLAIILHEKMGKFMFRKVRIHATDLNPQFDEVVSKGQYTPEQVGRIPGHIKDAYFRQNDLSDYYAVDDPLRRAVKFQQHDLTTLKPVGDDFDLILCKNVLLHLTPMQRIDVLEMFRDALRPGGYLGLEQTQKIPVEASAWFVPVREGGPVYQRC